MLIRKIKVEDLNELNDFYRLMIEDTFTKEGIGDLRDFIEEEIIEKNKYSKKALDDNDRVMIWVLIVDDQIVGTIGLAPSNEVIQKHYPEGKDLYEVHTLFVHPERHNNGYAGAMLNYLFNHIKDQETHIVLDSGYTIAKKIWFKKFGEPEKILKDYWAPGIDHHIWQINILDFLSK